MNSSDPRTRLRALNAALTRQHAELLLTDDEAAGLSDDEVVALCELEFERLRRIVSMS